MSLTLSREQGSLDFNAPAVDVWPGDETALLSTLIGYFEDSETASQDARDLADKCRDYYDGAQYTADEMGVLRRRKQPPSINNYVKRKIDLLRGMERRGRSDPKAFPRTDREENRADVATQVLRYIADDQRFDVVRSSVFDNMLIEGVGGVEVIVEPDPLDGGYTVQVNHLPYDRLFWDPHARHPAFTDALYLGLVIWMERDEALEMFPGCEDILSDTMSGGGASEAFGDRPTEISWADGKRQRVRVVQIYWKRGKDWWGATFTKGGFLRSAELSPYLDRHNNRTCPIILRSTYVDRHLRRYGVVRDMISPQDGVNKRESKLQHLLAVNQIIAEHGAVEDVDKARAEAAKPDGVLIHHKGFAFQINKDQAEIAGHFQMLQYSVQQMNVTGPNAAMAGKDPREQSGRAIIAQQAGGMVEHEPIADGLRQWSHKVYEAMWMRARQFWSEEKSVRVTDDEGDVQFIHLNRPVTLEEELRAMKPEDAAEAARMLGIQPGDMRLDQVVRIEHALDDLDVDITVEENSDTPTMAAEQFETLMRLPPQILMQFPAALIIKASSLRNKDDLLKLLERHQAMQMKAAEEPKAVARESALADVELTKAQAAEKRAKAVTSLHGIATDRDGAPGREQDFRASQIERMHRMASEHADMISQRIAATAPPPGSELAGPTPPGPPL